MTQNYPNTKPGLLSLLKRVFDEGLSISLEGEKLKLEASKSQKIDPELIQLIKANKGEIISFLQTDAKAYSEVNKNKKAQSIERRTMDKNIPLSYAQQQLWVIDNLTGSTAYHMPAIFRIKGKVPVSSLEEAFRMIVNRHEVLRTVYQTAGEDVFQKVLALDQWSFDNGGAVCPIEERALKTTIREWIDEPFNLAIDHLLRAKLFQLSEQEHVLVMVLHHIAADGWSLPILMNELTAIFTSLENGNTPDLPDLPIQYADYAIWQKEYLSDQLLDEKLTYWEQKLSGVAPSEFPTDFPRPNAQSNNGASFGFQLNETLTRGLETLARKEEVTLFTLLLSLFNVLLNKYSNQNDICVGIPVANRTQEEVESLIGFFVNTLALRSDLSANPTFHDLLQQVKENTLEAYANQEIPFEKIVSHVAQGRDQSRNAIFQIAFVMQEELNKKMDLGGMELIAEPFETTSSKFDLTLAVKRNQSTINMVVEYCSDLFSAERIERIKDHFQLLAKAVLQNPNAKISSYNMLTSAESFQLLNTFNDTATDYPKEQTIVDLFEAQVSQTPDNTALIFEDKTFTYRELNERVNQLAHYLNQNHTIRTEDLIGIKLERSEWIIIAVLSIFKTGAAYLPIDMDYPQERIDYMEKDGNCKLCIDAAFIEQFKSVQSNYSKATLPAKLKPSNLAYVMYTSGSTGNPKGVMIEHKSVVRLVKASKYYQFTAADVILSTGAFSFDATTFEYWGPLLNGGQLVLCSKNVLLDSDLLSEEIKKHSVNVMWFTSGWLSQLVESNIQIFEGLKTILSGGDKLSPTHVNWLRNAYDDLDIFNAYGPTENTTFSLTYPIQEVSGDIPIGAPISNSTVYILNEFEGLQAIGVSGEICVGGAGLARGYLNRPELSAEKFVPHPFIAGERVYKTGDLGRWLPDGNIEFLGRIDNQVKIRGHRIELGEIELAGLEIEGVSQCVVLARADELGNKRLMAYFITESAFDKEAIQENLRARLPDYMVPSIMMEMKEMPLNSNGKIDRKALPNPDISSLINNDFVAAQNKVQEQFVEIWKELLKVEKVGIRDNFFELGGDSIITIQVVSRAKRLGYQLLPKHVFENPTIEALAKIVDQQFNANNAEQGMLNGEAGQLPIQQWFFEQENTDQSYFNQALLLAIDQEIDSPELEKAIEAIVAQHDALRFTYQKEEEEWRQFYGEQKGIFTIEDLTKFSPDKTAAAISTLCEKYQASLDIEKGELIKAVFIKTSGAKNRLFLVVHHLAIDGVSWRIILDQLNNAVNTLRKNGTIDLGPKSSSYREWAKSLEKYAETKKVEDQLEFWQSVVQKNKALPVDTPATNSTSKEVQEYSIQLSESLTESLLKEVNQTYHTQINDILLSALAQTIQGWTNEDKFVFGLETHGREDLFEDLDISTTVGWFTSLYPVAIQLKNKPALGSLIKEVKEQLRAVPEKGIGYGLLRYLHPSKAIRESLTTANWEVVFNYLGQIDNVVATNSWFAAAQESTGPTEGPQFPFNNKMAVNGFVANNKLTLSWSYSTQQYRAETIETIARNYMENLEQLILHCSTKKEKEYTPSDYGLPTSVSNEELEVFLNAEANGEVKKDSLKDLYPLSSLQNGMLFHGLYDQSASVYTEQLHVDFPGGVEEKALQQAWQHLVDNNDVLRTAFLHEDLSVPVQAVYHKVDLPFQQLDFSTLSEAARKTAVEDFITADYSTGFDFTAPPLMRIALLRLTEKKYTMIWTFHHIILDGWSLSVLMEQFLSSYESFIKGNIPATKNTMEYGDYIKHLAKVDRYKEEQFWKNYLAGFDTPTLLPFVSNKIDRNKGRAVSTELPLTINQSLTGKLNAYAKANHLTLNTVIQGVWAFLLSRYTGSEDTVFGVTVSGRSSRIQQVESGVGLYINTLAMRSQMEENQKVADWLSQLQKGHTEAREYQYATLNKVQKSIGINNDFFDSILVFENYPLGELLTKDWSLKAENIKIKEQTNYLLTIVVTLGAELEINFTYNDALLSGEYVEMIRAHFETVIREIVEAKREVLTDIEMLTAEEKMILDGFNDTAVTYPEGQTFLDLFDRQVAQHANDTALIFEEEKITYGELNGRANQLANYLLDKGVTKESFVLLCLDRSIEMVVSLLAVMKAGGAYIPIDPLFPADRIRHIIKDAKAAYVISTRDYEAIFAGTEEVDIVYLKEEWFTITNRSTRNPAVICRPENLAYTIYTSGSTGLPKGVMIEHGALMNFLCSMANTLGAQADSSLLAVTTYSFDIAYLELYMPLLVGGQVIVASSEAAADSFALQDLIAKHEPTYLQATPATWKMLMNSAWENKEGVVVMSGGEAIKEELKNALTDLSDQKVWNLYGPTETTIWSTIQELKREERVNIGGPIANTSIYIVNNEEEVHANSLVPVGVIGELCIGGDGLARGYINRPDLNAEKFIANPFSDDKDSRIYRTGDLARWLPDGNIECLGRKDHQVKIRGYRIELGEIETVIQQCETVNQCVVHAKEDAKGNKRLVAYSIPNAGYDKKEIRSHLKSKLPDYMVPAIFMELETFPLTPNGKINRKALPEPDVSTLISNEYVAAQNETEKHLVQIWEELLKVEKVGTQDNFFELGGDSIICIQVVSKAKRMGIDISPRALFENPSIAELAEVVNGETNVNITGQSGLQLMTKTKSEKSVFCIPGALGETVPFYALAKLLDTQFNLYAFRAYGLDNEVEPLETVEGIAAAYIAEMQEADPLGPYQLAGYSFGSKVAFEMTKQLRQKGFEVAQLIILDAPVVHRTFSMEEVKSIEAFLIYIGNYAMNHVVGNFELTASAFKAKTRKEQIQVLVNHLAEKGLNLPVQQVEGIVNVGLINAKASSLYIPKIHQKVDVPILVFKARDKEEERSRYYDKMVFDTEFYGWEELTEKEVVSYEVEGNHDTFLNAPQVQQVAQYLRPHLDQSDQSIFVLRQRTA